MNEPAMKGLLKLVKNVLPADALKEGLSYIIKAAIDYKNEVEIDPEKGEVNSVLVLYDVNGATYTAVAVLNDENHVVRFENIRPVDELIELIKSNF